MDEPRTTGGSTPNVPSVTVNKSDPKFTSTVVIPFRVSITGAGPGSSYQTIWAPRAGFFWRLFGGVVDAFVGSTITTAAVDELTIFDGAATTRPVYPIAVVQNTWATGRELAYQREILLPQEGVRSTTLANALTVNVNSPASFTAGSIVVRGVVWGAEVRQ